MAGIIKSGVWESRSRARESPAFNFEDMTLKAEKYLEGMRQEGDRIIAAAQAKAAEIAAHAMDDVRKAAAAEAELRAQEQITEKLNELTPAVQQALHGIDQAKQSWVNHWEKETVALAVAIAERIARRELSLQPEIRVDLVREALQLAVGSGGFKLHLNPADAEFVKPWLSRLAGEELVPTEVIEDPTVSLGGCRVTTQFGLIDQTFEAQLARIEEELTA